VRQLLTLFTTPAVYLAVARLRRRALDRRAAAAPEPASGIR